MRDRATRGLLLTHLLSVIGEWAVIVGILVHAFAWGGAPAVGVVSLVMLIPPLVSAPLVGALQARLRTHTIRVGSLLGQMVFFSAAALAAWAGATTPLVAVFVLLGLANLTLIAPTTAALLPEVARSGDGLVKANLAVTYCDSTSGFIGPLAAGLIVAIGGTPAVFAAGTIGAAIGLLATAWRAPSRVRTARSGNVAQPDGLVRRTMRELRSNPWGRGVLLLLSARNLILGSLDVLLVILAIDLLDMGEGGPGYLGALVGAGALLSTLATTIAVRRARLRPSLMFAISMTALLAMGLGLRIERPIVFVALPLIGLFVAAIDALSRALLLRVTDPRSLAPLYASLAMVAALGQIIGSAIAQAMLWIGDAQLAFVAVGAALVLLAASSIHSLRRADEHANIPVVEMALLSGLPMMSALPSVNLEQVARAAESVPMSEGDYLVREGEAIDCCFVVSDGEFAVSARGRHFGELTRGDIVGEVALLTRLTPNTTVRARTDAMVLRIERDPFLAALTGHGVETSGSTDRSAARDRFRTAVAAHDRFADTEGGRPDTWLGLGAAGRMLGEPTYTDSLARSAEIAEAAGNDTVLAEAAALATWPGAFFFIADNPDHTMIELCERALVGLGRDDPVRVRVLATLASNLAFADDADRRECLIGEAHQLAATHRDPALRGAVLNAEFISMWEPGTLDRRSQIGPELTDIGEQIGDPELQYVGRFFTALCATEYGQLGDAVRDLKALRTLAPVAENEYFEFLSERLLLSVDIARGEPEVQSRIDALAERHAGTYADTDGTWALQVGGLAYEAGTLGTMVPTIISMLDGPHARTWRPALALAHVVADDHSAAAAVLADVAALPRSYFWLTAMQTQAEVAANIGDVGRCELLYAQLLPYRGQVGVTASGSRLYGLVSRSLGELALALGCTDDARELLTEAVGNADTMGMPFELTIARRLLAQTLAAAGRDHQAQQVAGDALTLAQERGYAREIALLRRV